MNFNCGEAAIEAEDNLGGGAFPRNCGSWDCEICAPRRRASLQREIISGKPNRFVSITCREGQFATVNIAAERLAWAWKIVVQRWRRLKSTNKCEFFVVREAQQNGWPHLHIAWRGSWLDFYWLRAQMEELLNSPQVDVRLIKGRSMVAYYIAKYIGKLPHKFGTLKRYWCSKDYRPKEKPIAKRIFRRELKFRPSDRTMLQVRDDLVSRKIEYTELYGCILKWDTPQIKPIPPPKYELRRLRFRRGFLKYVSKAGITPIETVNSTIHGVL